VANSKLVVVLIVRVQHTNDATPVRSPLTCSPDRRLIGKNYRRACWHMTPQKLENDGSTIALGSELVTRTHPSGHAPHSPIRVGGVKHGQQWWLGAGSEERSSWRWAHEPDAVAPPRPFDRGVTRWMVDAAAVIGLCNERDQLL
jgi:hypothetical protein